MANYSGQGHARRNELARAKGFRNYNEYRNATPAQRDAANARLARTNERYRATGGAKQSAPKRARRLRQDLGAAGDAIVSGRDRELRAFLRKATRDGARVYGRVTVRDDSDEELPAGQRPTETYALWSKGGIDPEWLLTLADALGRVRDAIAEQTQAGVENRKGYGLPDAWTIIDIQLVAQQS